MSESSDPPGPASYPTPPRIDEPGADRPDQTVRPHFVPDFRSPYATPPQRPQPPYAAPQFPPPSPAATRRAGIRPARVLTAAALLALLVGGGAGYFGARLGSSPTAGQSPGSSTSGPVVVTSPASVPGRHASAIPPLRGGADTVAIAQRLLPSTVTIRVTAAGEGDLGSGFVLDYHGRIMTNNHVVAAAAGGGSIMVTFSDGHRSRAQILGRSPSYDIAVIEVADRKGLHPATLGDSNDTKVGEAAVAIGSPLGLGGTVTEGIVSAVNRPVAVGDANSADGQAYLNAVQTDAPINHGNSGGPLVDGTGDVIGVNSAILTGSTTDQQNSGNIGIGFAIPINQARQIADLLIKDGHASYPVINATVTSDSSGDGVVLNSVTPGGAADQAGLRPDDVIVAIDGQPVGEAEDLIVAIRNHRPGDIVTLEFERNGQRHSAEVRLASKRG
jgi:putative serine protease PepD